MKCYSRAKIGLYGLGWVLYLLTLLLIADARTSMLLEVPPFNIVRENMENHIPTRFIQLAVVGGIVEMHP